MARKRGLAGGQGTFESCCRMLKEASVLGEIVVVTWSCGHGLCRRV